MFKKLREDFESGHKLAKPEVSFEHVEVSGEPTRFMFK
jgi:hypothetical protein